jgi:hypothetical protein
MILPAYRKELVMDPVHLQVRAPQLYPDPNTATPAMAQDVANLVPAMTLAVCQTAALDLDSRYAAAR